MSLFGEITEPGTRTAFEDWDDAAQNNIADLTWNNMTDVPDTIDLLIILDGKHIADSLRLHTQDSVELINTIKEASLSFYRIKLRNAYICVLKDYNLLQSSEIVELLRDYIVKSKDVIAILNKPIAEYQTSNMLYQSCVVRSLTTTKSPSRSYGLDFPKLEQPNIISGVAAGVLTLRQHLDLPATVVIYYMEYLESCDMEEVQNLLQKLDISVVSKPLPNSITNSNLYI